MGVKHLSRIEIAIICGGALVFLGLSAIGITRFPAPWWDEGWTLSVAKNWVTLGHYGHLLDGVRTGPSLSAHLPVVAIVACSFLVFGVGLAQARMAMIVCTALTLIALYLLTRAIASRSVAVVTLVLVTFLPMQWDLSLFVLGRNVLGEVPSLLFILLSLLILLASEGKRPVALGLAGIGMGIALASKMQVVPFAVFALAVAGFQAFLHDRRRGAAVLGVLALALVVYYAVNGFRQAFLVPAGIPVDPVVGLTNVNAMVLDPEIRSATIRFVLLTGSALTLALSLELTRIGRRFRRSTPLSWTDVVRTILALIAGSWLAWFALLSIGWGRYGLPAFVLGAPFVAGLITELLAITRRTPLSGDAGVRRQAARFACAGLLLFFAFMAGRQLWIGAQAIAALPPPSGLDEMAAYLNHQTAEHATVETYDSEVLFVVERHVHVPPAQVNVEFLRRNYLGGTNALGYDFTSIHADFLVVGEFGRGFYAPLIERGSYLPVRRFGTYDLYQKAAVTR